MLRSKRVSQPCNRRGMTHFINWSIGIGIKTKKERSGNSFFLTTEDCMKGPLELVKWKTISWNWTCIDKKTRPVESRQQ